MGRFETENKLHLVCFSEKKLHHWKKRETALGKVLDCISEGIFLCSKGHGCVPAVGEGPGSEFRKASLHCSAFFE